MELRETKKICDVAIGGTVAFGVISAVLYFSHVWRDVTGAFVLFFVVLAVITSSARKKELNQKDDTESLIYLFAVDFVACLLFIFCIFFRFGRYFIGMI